MSTVVIEAGPVTVRGPGTVAADRAATAVECIDDPIALIDDQPVAVDVLWTELIGAAGGAQADALILVCPTWWTTDQLALIRNAGAEHCADSVVLQRMQALRAGSGHPSAAVVEIADDVVVVARPGTDPVCVARCDDTGVVDTVLRLLDGADAVIVDAPGEVARGAALGREVTTRLRGLGVAVSTADAALLDAVGLRRATAAVPPAGPDAPVRRRPVLVAAALILAALCAGAALATGHRPGAGESSTPLVEGRVEMRVPAGWAVQRVTGGPGSARVQVVSPSDPDVVLHLTQSDAPAGESAGRLGDALRRALDEEPAGVFVDFNPGDRIAGRDVASYRELRADREVRWAVLLDGPVRIAIGCQSAPGRAETVAQPCRAAVESAHAVR
ncbi:type VII secretion-associated protein [Mycobacterium sp. NPDC003449]